MQLIEFKDETIYLNWDDIPDETLRFDIQLRNKIFKELQDTFSENTVTTTILFKMNEYVINRLKEIKNEFLHNKSSNKNS